MEGALGRKRSSSFKTRDSEPEESAEEDTALTTVSEIGARIGEREVTQRWKYSPEHREGRKQWYKASQGLPDDLEKRTEWN